MLRCRTLKERPTLGQERESFENKVPSFPLRTCFFLLYISHKSVSPILRNLTSFLIINEKETLNLLRGTSGTTHSVCFQTLLK